MKDILIKIIKLYQITPLLSHSHCRFTPTCSEYAIEAIETFGVKKGLKLSFKRILRCHPGGKFGYDPVKKERL
jgi:uncharacterized protein